VSDLDCPHKISILNTISRSLTTGIKDDTSSIRRNVKGNAMTLDQITEVLTTLPEQIALQLQGQTLQLNISPEISTTRESPLLATAAPTMDFAHMLENLFPPTAVDGDKVLTGRPDFALQMEPTNPTIRSVREHA
jgi:hypothetical protein